ncbi:hypothetical protein TgHK011_007608 [Trichoderma gracile]|nr:hypothetical protein TgHK011_007608 [Trichoderma gracile]
MHTISWARWLIRRSSASTYRSRSANTDRGRTRQAPSPGASATFASVSDTLTKKNLRVVVLCAFVFLCLLPSASYWCNDKQASFDSQGVQPKFCAAAQPATTPCAPYSLRPHLLGHHVREPLDPPVDRPSDAALIGPINAASQDTESYSFPTQARGCLPLLVPACPPDFNPRHQVYGHDELSRHLATSLPVTGKHILYMAPPI